MASKLAVKTGRKSPAALLAMLMAFATLLIGAPANAAGYLSIETTIYEWEEETGNGPAIGTAAQVDIAGKRSFESFGPFHIVSGNRAEIHGDLGSDAPRQFRRMLTSYPQIKQIDFINCPGTVDDTANLAVARMIRKAGITTHVPAGGFVASGGVELFLAGVKRSADPNAEFAVHSWIDEDGMQADDFAMNDPVHQSYLAYYREMGMSAQNALAFYQMTNSAPYEDALYLKPRDIAAYIPMN